MANPVFGSSPIFSEKRTPNQPSEQAPNYGATHAGVQAASAANLNQMYQAPSAGPMQTGRMTYEDVVMRTGMLFGMLLLAAVAAWTIPAVTALWWVGLIVGFVLGLVNAFKKNPSPLLISGYAIAEGVFLGGISKFFETLYDGIVIQAVLGTLAVFAVILVLFMNGKIRTSPRGRKIVLGAMLGYLVFSLVNLVLMWTGVLDNAWGMRGATIAGIPLGLIIGILAVCLAAYSLVMDFEAIQAGVQNGAPEKFSWKAGFGLLVTLVWLYLEILRILAILRGD